MFKTRCWRWLLSLGPENSLVGSIGLLGMLGLPVLAQPSPKAYSVLVSAEVQSDPPRIQLTWPVDSTAAIYRVARKEINASTWTPMTVLPGDAHAFEDTAVTLGSAFEYQLIKTNADLTGYGYIRAGVDVPLVDTHGKVILMVASNYAPDLAAELAQLEQDLVGDGWTVLRHDVSPEESVPNVKSLIQSDYAADPGKVEAVFLFGRVPVPYSGAISPDGHPNHRGAWPADVYYADVQGVWTDSSVTSTNAEQSRNWNIPGDGKFDQDRPPGIVALQIGRVDLSNMTSFSNKTPARSEKDLLRQYLIKDHNFRHRLLTVQRRALICDNFFDKGSDPIGGSAWRNFPGFFSAANITEVGWTNYFPAVTAQSYLWTFASGGGQYYTCTGVGSSDDFALQDIQAVFTMWLGSYFGDWDTESNFLRAPLGSSTYTLTSSYSGFPQWLYHPMALGETIGSCARLTQNNRIRGLYPPFNPGAGQVHVSLLGDPTLRMHPVIPPSDLSATNSARGIRLTWSPSGDSALVGYHVYRAATPSGPFVRLTGTTPTVESWFVDNAGPGTYRYMVRAVKLESSASGTYFNASQGIFTTASQGTSSAPLLNIAHSDKASVQLQVVGQAGQQVAVERSADLVRWKSLMTNSLTGGSLEFVDPVTGGPGQSFYRCRELP